MCTPAEPCSSVYGVKPARSAKSTVTSLCPRSVSSRYSALKRSSCHSRPAATPIVTKPIAISPCHSHHESCQLVASERTATTSASASSAKANATANASPLRRRW